MEEEIMECFVKGETVEQVQKKFPKYTEAEIRKISKIRNYRRSCKKNRSNSIKYI